MARKPDRPCASCGKLIWVGSQSLPEGQAMCQPCRKASLVSASTCGHCGESFTGRKGRKFCSRSCHADARRIHPGSDAKREKKRRQASRRNQRDRLAPGPYTPMRRKALLARWQKQGRACIYCEAAPADTVDHVIPLALGGTNYEGNLAPACFDCNRLKMDNLLSAWRYGISVRKWRVPVEVKPRRQPRPRRAVQVVVEFKSCHLCSSLFVPRSARQMLCSSECAVEANARRNRDMYRARHGLPIDERRPTRPRRRAGFNGVAA